MFIKNVLGLAMVATVFTSPVLAADFPTKAVKIIVNYGAGGGVDRTARSVQRFLPDALGQSVVVENHKGAGGKIGLKKFMAAPRDGYTILTAFAPATTVVKYKDPKVFKNDDLAIINVQWSDPVMIVAHKNTGWKSLEDMIQAVKASPGKYSFASSGKGSAGPIMSNILFDKLGLKVKIVPYKGGGKTRAAFKGGHVDMTAGGSGGNVPIRNDAVNLGVFWSGEVAEWPDSKSINSQIEKYGVSVPEAAAYRFHAVHREVKEKYPERFKALVKAFKDTTTMNKDFIAFADKAKIKRDWFGPEKSQALINEVDARFDKILRKYWK